uniref:Late embryogenesis abundant n=1 Tax=Cleistogenes songorica TaxID=121774 RepID=A0A2S1WLP5_9POAL|nr:late embryogenesis abundant [Cleistogenes songorica]
MSSSEDITATERGKSKDNNEDGDRKEGGGGFIDKVKDFIHDIGEKIEEAVGFGKPTADISGIHIPHISLHRADLVVDVLIKNPNPVPIPLVDIDYLIDSDGRKLVSGLIPDAGTIHAHGQETSTYKDIQPGSIIPYLVRVVLLVDVPIIGRIKIPLQKSGEIPVPYKPDVDVEKIKFHRFTFEETTATLHLKLENKNDFDLGLNMLQYEMWLGDDSIVSAELTETAKIEKQGITRMQVPFSFRPKEFGSAVWDMIRGRGIGYTIKGKIDADTPFGNMKLPISKEGGTTRLKKDDDDDDDETNEHPNERRNKQWQIGTIFFLVVRTPGGSEFENQKASNSEEIKRSHSTTPKDWTIAGGTCKQHHGIAG